MNLSPELLNVCLAVEGFPPQICPAEIARQVSLGTGTIVEAIAPLNPASGGWLLRLCSHDDQKRCVQKIRALTIQDTSGAFQVKLDPPHLPLSSDKLNWISVKRGQDTMDSVASVDMFGEGGSTIPKKARKKEEPGTSSEGVPFSPPGPQSRQIPPQSMGPGFYHTRPPLVPQRATDHPAASPFQSSVSSNSSNPNLSALGVDPRSVSSSSDVSSGGFEMGPQSQPGFSPVGRGRGAMRPGMPNTGHFPGMYGPPLDSNPAYPANPLSPSGVPGHLYQDMANLGFNQPPAPPFLRQHYTPSEVQERYYTLPEGFPGTSGDHKDMDYQSDFVILDSTGEERSQQDHNIYLKVTELPVPISESELREFFQSRHLSGGGPVKHVDFSPATNTAAIVFEDNDDVERVLHRAPLLLKGKKINMEKAYQDQQEPEIKTVEIRGLTSELDSETCYYYFENPKNGGDIESKEWNDAEKIFLITFVDAAVAKAAASKGHKLGSKVLEVSLYTPPAEDEDTPQCTVLVRGFDPDMRDLYEMYFSNPRKGGDEIVELRISDDQNAMYITFETPEVAERIAGMTHKVGGRQLEVVLAPIERQEPPSTVMVTGCDLSNPDLYQFYFENPRKGGGEISHLEVDEKRKAILITFSDPEVAQQVCDKQHKVGNTTLGVSLYTPDKASPSRQSSQEPMEKEEEEEPAPKTVVVAIGNQPLESSDTYSLYFESPRHGGGDVEDVDVDEEKKLVYVTFAEAEVAARVAGKQHRFNNQPLDVKLYIPPKPKPTYPNKLLFKNVADSTTRDCLIMYLERVTGLEPQEILYGDEVGTVLVTFDEEPDLAGTVQQCQRKGLEGRKLTVSKVPITNCLLVDNLNPATTPDTIEFYFENKRSLGGPVERVDLRSGEKKCFIYFEDHTVLDGVLSRAHKLDGHHLSVKRYMECLGESGGSEDPTAFSLPKPLTLTSIHPHKVAFLRQSKNAQAGFVQQLALAHAKGKFSGDTLEVECTLTPAVPKARILARTWAVDTQQTVESYVGLLEVFRRDVMQTLWEEVEKAVRAAGFNPPDGAALLTLSQESAFVVVGVKSMAQELFQKVSDTIKTVEEAIERQKQQVTETNSKLKNYQLRLLLAMGFHVEAEKRHGGMKVDIQLKKNCIVFTGLLKDIKEAQVEMYEVVNPARSDKMTKLSHMQHRLLESKEVKPYIVSKFKKENIVAVWELDAQNQMTVYAFTDECLVAAIHIINKAVPEHVCELSAESVNVLHTAEWANLVQQLTNANPGVLLITPAHDSQKVYITCIDSLMHGVVEDVERFLQENSIYSQVARFSPSRQTFVMQEWSQKLINIQNSLRAHKVHITMKEAGTELYVKGTSQGLVELRKRLEDLNAQIVCHEEKLQDIAKIKCLNTDHTERDLKILGQTNHCVVSLQPEGSDLEVVQVGSAVATSTTSGSAQTVASVELPNGVMVAAVLGDITQLPVDVIVNAANNRMQHAGGLAADIVTKGGQSIQDESTKAVKAHGGQVKEGELLVTGGGRLPCKAIYHAVGPIYRGGYAGEEDCLHDTIIKCLTRAADSGHASIAFPAISTGVFRYPVREATRVIVEALKDYLNSHRKSKVRRVYVCHIAADTVDMFADAIGRVFPSARSSSALKNKPLPAPRSGLTIKGASPQDTPTSQRVIKVSVVEGEIAKQSVDVIVNSTSNGLDLQNGAISGSILRMAGQGLQDECRQRHPKGVESGDIARTSGHNLACKEVYHMALINFMHPNSQQALGASLMKCLTEASRQHYQSIAFPVLGTGNLGYPADVVANIMLTAINQFQQNTPSTSLRDACIVVYHADKKNLKIFQEALKKTGGGLTPTQPQASSKPTGSRKSRKFSMPGDGQPKPSTSASGSEGTSASFEIGALKLIIKQGDITEEKVDAIVNSSNLKLDLSRGHVSSALKAKCGEELIKECKKKEADLQKRHITNSKAYHISCKRILHINSEHFAGSKWGDAITLCLEEAEALGVQTLAMPALGTGAFGQTPSQSASALFHAVVAFFSVGSRNLKELRVLLFDLKMIPPFVGAVEELGNKHAQGSSGILNWFKSAFTGSSVPAVRQISVPSELKEASLYIYTGSQKDIPTVLRAFEDLVKERCVRKEVSDDALLELRPEEMEQIYMLQKEHSVQITVEQARGRVVVEGLQNDVFDVAQRISQILRQAERSKQELQAASMLANMVQWSYLEVTPQGTKSEEYGQKENQIIELAYQSKKKKVEIADTDGNVYVIDFDVMNEYPKLNPSDTVSVLRRDKIKEMARTMLPENWTPHNPNEHVKVVQVQPTDQEYQDVEKNLRATLGNDRTVNILTIERVQNRTLYQQYASKKALLEKQNQGIENEKTLWHGTGPEAIENINNYGFNRSYCGKNATVWGDGVYFAVNSNYSTHPTYSPPDSSGKRYVYQCKVLVGHATTGKRGLRVLPARKGPILFDSATDNPTKNSMFIIFNDTQAYPEYLITFKST